MDEHEQQQYCKKYVLARAGIDDNAAAAAAHFEAFHTRHTITTHGNLIEWLATLYTTTTKIVLYAEMKLFFKAI